MTHHPDIVYVDIETTGLDPERHQPWEIALVTDRWAECWQVPVDLAVAEPGALRISGFYDRSHQVHRHEQLASPLRVAEAVAAATAGKYLAGAVPSFDATFLDRFLRRHGHGPAWRHRLICVESVAAGALREDLPVGLSDSAAALGINVDGYDLHHALGDAQLARDVHHAALAFYGGDR